MDRRTPTPSHPRRPARPPRSAAGPRAGRRGFTLVELMVVIAIIGLLAATVTVHVMGQVVEAQRTKVRADFHAIGQALDLYRLKRGRYPAQLSGLTEGGPGRTEPLLKALPRDPWGNGYVYTLHSAREWELVSYGADGAPGGSDDAADLSSRDEPTGP